MATKSAKIQIKRGNKVNLPSTGMLDGELLYTKDTHELYAGNTSGGVDLIKNVVKSKEITLALASWVQVSELWTYNIYDSDFKADSHIDVIPPLPTSPDSSVFMDADFFATAKANVGYVTLYAKNKPLAAITITYIIL